MNIRFGDVLIYNKRNFSLYYYSSIRQILACISH